MGCVTMAKQRIWEWDKQGSLDWAWGLDVKSEIGLEIRKSRGNLEFSRLNPQPGLEHRMSSLAWSYHTVQLYHSLADDQRT